MGFRSTYISEDYWLPLPQWFVDKYDKQMSFGSYEKDGLKFKGLPIASKFERKFYMGADEELFKDIQELLNTQSDTDLKDLELVLFHECEGITKVHIGKDFIRFYEPQDWETTDGVTHNYCYGCSNPKVAGQLATDGGADDD